MKVLNQLRLILKPPEVIGLVNFSNNSIFFWSIISPDSYKIKAPNPLKKFLPKPISIIFFIMPMLLSLAILFITLSGAREGLPIISAISSSLISAFFSFSKFVIFSSSQKLLNKVEKFRFDP